MHFLEWLYYLGMSSKRAYMLRNQRRLPCRVISIGNLTTGGTGKTPCTVALAKEALERGLKPVILTRGYKGSARGPVFVSRGEGPLVSVREAGDEPFLMAVKLDRVPIVKGGDRFASGLYAIEHLAHCGWNLETTVFILDDGYQHWGLQRDKDILLIDVTNPFGTGRLLPLGRLREPLAAIGRADYIVLTRTEDGEDRKEKDASLIGLIRRYNPESPVFRSVQKPVVCRTSSGEALSQGWLKGRKVFAFCGLGNPDSFRKTLESEGAMLLGMKVFRDHYCYRRGDVRAIEAAAAGSGAEWIVTTEKDMIKFEGQAPPSPTAVVDAGFSADVGFYDEVFAGPLGG